MTATPVTVIGGYLGAGKTTLVNHLLATSPEPVAVLVNDFGDVSIDADLIVSHDGTTMELANGCICCTMVDGFVDALATVADDPRRRARILIEASGVAHPATVAAYAHRPGLRYDGTVVAVDITDFDRLLADRYVGDTVRAQLGAADIVLATKADRCTPDEVSERVSALADVADAPVVPIHDGRVAPEILVGIEPAEPTQPAPGITPADFASVTCTRRDPLPRAALEAAMHALPDGVVRAKGLVRFEGSDDPWAVHRVGRRVDMAPAPDAPGGDSRVVLMGRADALPGADWLVHIG